MLNYEVTKYTKKGVHVQHETPTGGEPVQYNRIK